MRPSSGEWRNYVRLPRISPFFQCVSTCVCVLVKHQHVRRCVRQNETLIFSFIHSATRRSLNKLTAAGEAVVLHVAPICVCDY